MALVDQTVRVSVNGSLSGNERWANVWHVRYLGTDPADPVLDADLDDVEADFVTFYTALLDRQANVTTVDNMILSQLGDVRPPRAYGPALTGTGGTDILPTQLAVCLTLNTETAGRSFRGRIFIAGLDNNALSAGSPRLTTTYRDDIGNSAAALSTALAANAAPAAIAVYSRKLDVATLVSSYRVGTVIDTQRRRRAAINEQYATFTF